LIIKLALAFLLDILVGDPYWFPHPVRGMGKLIQILEKLLYRSCFNLKISGVILATLVVGISWFGGFVMVNLASRAGKWLEIGVESFLIFTTLSVKNLADEARGVYQALDKDDIKLARRKVGRIVGRDTHNLSKSEIIRATVETVAENSVDGVISPLFFALLGGAPLALAYRAINTLDSMVGYKNQRYKDFGWFSARLDDVTNFIPARIAALFIPLAAFLTTGRGKDSFRIILRDGKKSPSPNAAIPEAGFAGALGIKLGGRNFYQGKEESRPLIGENLKEKNKKDILVAIKIMRVLSALVLLVFIGGYWTFINMPFIR